MILFIRSTDALKNKAENDFVFQPIIRHSFPFTVVIFSCWMPVPRCSLTAPHLQMFSFVYMYLLKTCNTKTKKIVCGYDVLIQLMSFELCMPYNPLNDGTWVGFSIYSFFYSFRLWLSILDRIFGMQVKWLGVKRRNERDYLSIHTIGGKKHKISGSRLSILNGIRSNGLSYLASFGNPGSRTVSVMPNKTKNIPHFGQSNTFLWVWVSDMEKAKVAMKWCL